MQVARQVATVLSKDPSQVKLEWFKLRWGPASERGTDPDGLTESQRVEMEKSAWSGQATEKGPEFIVQKRISRQEAEARLQ